MSQQPADARTLAALLHIARQALPQVDYLGEYRAKIISQNADGTCEVQPDDVRIPATSKVPIRYGTPGQSVKLKLKPGARAVIGFELGAADAPPRMIVTAWETASVEEATLEASSTIKIKAGVVELAYGAARNVACVGDFAQVGGPNPIPCLIQMPTGPNTGAPQPATITFPVPVMAPIVSGSSGAKAP
jgi:hypothetical protein